MHILGVVSGVDAVSLWGEEDYDFDVNIVYEMCPQCRMIFATSQCT